MSKKLQTITVPDRVLPENMSHEGITAVLNLNAGSLLSRNIRIHERRTSIRLDDRMWYALNEIAHQETCTIHEICTAIYDHKGEEASLSTSLRVFLMNYYRITAQNEKASN